jgi:NTP pyrophosphatase (non-canonical NTP hydrolase)
MINTQEPFFNFGELSRINWARCTSSEGFNYNPDSVQEFNAFMVIAMAEEMGEIAGAWKKLMRGFNKRELAKMKKKHLKANPGDLNMPTDDELKAKWHEQKFNDLKDESSDLFTYLDLFLTRNGIDIKRAVTRKFNEVSNEMECRQFKLNL